MPICIIDGDVGGASLRLDVRANEFAFASIAYCIHCLE